MRWQHAMIPVADQPDVLPGLILSDLGDRTEASDRVEYVDRSGVAPSIVTPDGIRTRGIWRRRLHRLGAVVIVVLMVAGTSAGAWFVLDRLLADDAGLATSSTDQEVGPVSVSVPDGLVRSDCGDPPLITTCVRWQEGQGDDEGGNDTVFVVQVADLGSRLDESALRGVLPRFIERLGMSPAVAFADPDVTVGDNRTTITAEASVDGVEGRATVVVIGRWSVTVLAAGPEGYLEWHDAVVASARRT
jgi:hypothetical protein